MSRLLGACAAMLLLSVPAAAIDSTIQGEAFAKVLRKADVSATSDDLLATAEAAIKANPSNPAAHARLGFILVGKKSLDDAMRSFEEALRLNPGLHEAKTGKGVVLAAKGNLKEAEKVLQEALDLNPNPVRTHYELGLVYQRLNEFEKAVAEFKEGVRKHELGRE